MIELEPLCKNLKKDFLPKIKDSKKPVSYWFENAMSGYSNQRFVKIFTSGSFLDEDEVPLNARKEILNTLEQTTDKVSVESRPEYVKDKTLNEIRSSFSKTFELGVGLESAR